MKLVTMCVVFLCSGLALASVTPEQKCQAAKNLAAGKYLACRQNAEKRSALTPDATKYSEAIAKCDASLAKSWQGAIDKATAVGAACLDAPLAAGDYKPVLDALSTNVATALAGGGLTLPTTCGNGSIEAGESCDFGTLGGASCNTATAGAKPFGGVSCGAGCVLDTSGCFPCPGTLALGACWLHNGVKGDSCTSICAAHGLAYDPATATVAGSGGSSANCLAVASALFPFYTSPPYPSPLFVQNTSSSGVGCTVFNLPTLVRDTVPTLADAGDAQLARICACH
jgi:hypothetical protein